MKALLALIGSVLLAGAGAGASEDPTAEVRATFAPEGIDAFALGVLGDGCKAVSRPLTPDELARYAPLGGIEAAQAASAVAECNGGFCGCLGCYLVPSPWGNIPLCVLCGVCCGEGEQARCECSVPTLWELRCTCDEADLLEVK